MSTFPPSTPQEVHLAGIGSKDINASEIEKILQKIAEYLRTPIAPLAKPLENQQIIEKVQKISFTNKSITAMGLGIDTVLDIFNDVLSKQGIPTNHPGYLSYIGVSPTPTAVLADSLMSTTGMIGSAWLGGAGLIWAENQALQWLIEISGLPSKAGGCFVSGGTAGNFSSLAAARDVYRNKSIDVTSGLLLVGESAHASITNCAKLLDLTTITIPCDSVGKISAQTLSPLLDQLAAECKLEQVVAIVASAGSTNNGQIDKLHEVGSLAQAHNIWFHIDAAYGGAFLCVPSIRDEFNGIELANSLIVDPHKGLFVPYDCCALLFSDPKQVPSAFYQDAPYLDHINATTEYNPMHYALHLTRRARGFPLWFSLATHGYQAYINTLSVILDITLYLKNLIRDASHLELIENTSLSVILFKRNGWTSEQYYAWSNHCLAQGLAFVVPTHWRHQTVLRICIMNAQVEEYRLHALIESLKQ